MGLSIDFFEKVEIVGAHQIEWEDDSGQTANCLDYKHHHSGYVHPSFPFTRRGLERETFHFNTSGQRRQWQNSYGGHSRWRKQLFALVDPIGDISDLWASDWDNEQEQRDFPFLEILNFSDCEGSYTGEVAADLLKDFRDFQGQAEKVVYDDLARAARIDFYSYYVQYMEGLEIVGPDGLVTYG